MRGFVMSAAVFAILAPFGCAISPHWRAEAAEARAEARKVWFKRNATKEDLQRDLALAELGAETAVGPLTPLPPDFFRRGSSHSYGGGGLFGGLSQGLGLGDLSSFLVAKRKREARRENLIRLIMRSKGWRKVSRSELERMNQEASPGK